ncbi:MAG: PspC domain-containing protein [Candidatus Heimdallarchaeota archaeon]
MTLYCPSCGAVNEEFAEFCANCGESLAKARDRKAENEKAKQEKTSEGAKEKKLYRSRSNKMVTGLSAGLAKYLDLDVDLVRILWLIAFVVSGGVVLVVYLIMAMAIPLEPEV